MKILVTKLGRAIKFSQESCLTNKFMFSNFDMNLFHPQLSSNLRK